MLGSKVRLVAISLLFLIPFGHVAEAQYNAISGQIPLCYIVELDPKLTTLERFKATSTTQRPKGAAGSEATDAGDDSNEGLPDAITGNETTTNLPIPVAFGRESAPFASDPIAALAQAENSSDAPLQYRSAETTTPLPAENIRTLVTTGGQEGGDATRPSFLQRVGNRLFGLTSLPEGRPINADYFHRYSRSRQQTRGFYFSVRQEFSNEQLFFGISITLQRSSDVTLLGQIVGVKSVTPVNFVRRPSPFSNKVQLASKPSFKQINEHYSSLSATGVDKAHAEGFNGTGVKVAVIDTGVDYTHQALGGCFGPGCKIAFGFDFVGDAYDGSNDPKPDPDPLSQCGPHGTHVTGIIAAQDQRYPIVGVAPAATIGAYRVFGCTGGTADDVLMKAMETAYDDGADVLTVSIGAPAGWVESPTAKLASSIATQGRVVSIAAGNEGSAGMFFPSTPAVGEDVISVGSVDNAFYVAFNATISGGKTGQVPYFSAKPLLLPPLPMYATSFDSLVANDACDPLPDYTPDLSQMVVLTKRGGCSFEQKFQNIAAFNGKYVIIYNTDLAPVYIEPLNGISKAVMIDMAYGQMLVRYLQSGVMVRISFPDGTMLAVANNFTAGIASPFSSYGPTFDLSSQTDMMAPGAQILGLWPVPLGNYSIVSGTSMATPYIAGAAALLIQAARENRTLLAESVLNRLRSTALPIFNSTGSSKGILDTVAKQGAGLLQMMKALHYTTHITPSMLLLNDTTFFRSEQYFTVTNTADVQVAYDVFHEPAGTALTFPKGNAYPYAGAVPLVDSHAAVSITPMAMTIDPGENVTVKVVFTAPSGANVPDPSTFPVYSGFIRVFSSPTNESLTVSYLGLGAKLSSMKMLDSGNGVTKAYTLPAVLVGGTGKVQRLPRTYTFQNGDVPVLQFRLIAGSRVTKVKLIQAITNPVVDVAASTTTATNQDPQSTLANTVVKATRRGIWIPPFKALDMIAFAPVLERALISGSTDELTPANIVGQVAAASWLPRNSLDPDHGIYAMAWDGSVDGIGKVKAGDYQLHLQTLRLGFEVPSDSNSTQMSADAVGTGSDAYEQWYSPIIRVQ